MHLDDCRRARPRRPRAEAREPSGVGIRRVHPARRPDGGREEERLPAGPRARVEHRLARARPDRLAQELAPLVLDLEEAGAVRLEPEHVRARRGHCEAGRRERAGPGADSLRVEPRGERVAREPEEVRAQEHRPRQVERVGEGAGVRARRAPQLVREPAWEREAIGEVGGRRRAGRERARGERRERLRVLAPAEVAQERGEEEPRRGILAAELRAQAAAPEPDPEHRLCDGGTGRRRERASPAEEAREDLVRRGAPEHLPERRFERGREPAERVPPDPAQPGLRRGEPAGDHVAGTRRSSRLPPGSAAPSLARGEGGCAGGRRTRKTDPFPGADSTSISPPRPLTIPWQIERPSPVPTPTGFVVKNGSKIRGRTLRRDAAAGVGDLDARAPVRSRSRCVARTTLSPARPPGSPAPR